MQDNQQEIYLLVVFETSMDILYLTASTGLMITLFQQHQNHMLKARPLLVQVMLKAQTHYLHPQAM